MRLLIVGNYEADYNRVQAPNLKISFVLFLSTIYILFLLMKVSIPEPT